jgi:predicted porin
VAGTSPIVCIPKTNGDKILKDFYQRLVPSLTVLCGATSVNAQANLYGIADSGIEFVNRASPGSMQRLVSGGESGSRLGFRVREDLGGGLSSFAVLESGINLDVGTYGQGGLAFGRTAHVGIAGGFGQLSLGRQTSITNEHAAVFEGVGRASRYSSASIDSFYASRIDNALRYSQKWGSTHLLLQYAPGEVIGSSRANRYLGIAGRTTVANLTLGVARDERGGATVALAGHTVSRTSVGAAYSLGKVRFVGNFTKRQGDLTGGGSRHDLAWIAVQYQPSSSWFASATLHSVNDKRSENDSSMLALFGSYALSRRTNVYVHAAHSTNKGAAALGVAGFGTTVSGASQSGVTVGIRHIF